MTRDVTELLNDSDVGALLRPELAVAAMSAAMVAAHRGTLHTPARLQAHIGDNTLVFTAGSMEGECYGYRSYDTARRPGFQQVVVVHDAATGSVRAVAVGNQLGPKRTGALGGATVAALANDGAAKLALIGIGPQARAQLWAIAGTRPIAQISAHSRTEVRRDDFAQRIEAKYQIPCVAAKSAQEAVEDADIVVLATTSGAAVIDASWLKPGAFIAALGPKEIDNAEFGRDLVDDETLVVTDSLNQLASFGDNHVLHDLPAARFVSVGAIIAGDHPGRASKRQRVVYLSLGLAGTEVYLLNELLKSRR